MIKTTSVSNHWKDLYQVVISVNCHGEENRFHPEAVSSLIVTTMTETAEFLGTPSEWCRRHGAGLFHVSRTYLLAHCGPHLKEPTAVAIAYELVG